MAAHLKLAGLAGAVAGASRLWHGAGLLAGSVVVFAFGWVATALGHGVRGPQPDED